MRIPAIGRMAIKPRFAPGLSLTVDWYEITVHDAIASQSATQILSLCAQRAGVFCDLVTRDASTGAITNLLQGVLNLAEIKTSGVDTTLRYDFSTGIGKFYHTADGKPAKLRHVILQHVIRVEGDRAWGRSLWLEMANHGEGDQPKIGTYGMYEDEFVRLDGHWLIKRRNVLNDFIPNRGTGPDNPVRAMDATADAR